MLPPRQSQGTSRSRDIKEPGHQGAEGYPITPLPMSGSSALPSGASAPTPPPLPRPKPGWLGCGTRGMR